MQTATQYFENNIGKVTSAQQLVDNPRLFDYAMTAFGLSDMTYAKGLMEKVLQQGVTSSTALANTLDNTNILSFAKAFDFTDNGATTTASSSLVDLVVNKYVENSLETAQGQQNPGVQLALYFQAQAPNVTSVYQILADKNLLSVVQTALGIAADGRGAHRHSGQHADIAARAFGLSKSGKAAEIHRALLRPILREQQHAWSDDEQRLDHDIDHSLAVPDGLDLRLRNDRDQSRDAAERREPDREPLFMNRARS